eukprot:gnl/TRDRNA2_/TRDRNA2_80638_c0_seq1.p1 gnl/TRDRNA2_/TRDRNA2_80638_c0~~gnl/TRDRNA2_/TRDRNA2_80638_c0_seq1.p1  ORF type:complete len:630 (+),score=122.07 gnl/TRDRNA2_/TRDRNA2_80638_c0_seq1:38-1927(+)
MRRFLHEQRSRTVRDVAKDTVDAQASEHFDEFQGRIFIVDLSQVDGQTEDFDGSKWLDNRVKDGRPLGFAVEWSADRTKDSDNPVALMQFATDDTVLLLRTHVTKNWLPAVVVRALESTECEKLCMVFEGAHKEKVLNTFNFIPSGISELCVLADEKGLPEEVGQGLKSLAEHFGLHIRRDTRIARSNWAAPELSQEQARFAAEEAYFCFHVFKKVAELEDAEHWTKGNDINKGVLEIMPQWIKHGIIRKSDGLWCNVCNRGPMLVPMVVEKHIEGKKHMSHMEAKGLVEKQRTVAEELSEKYIVEGIVEGNGIIPDLRVGEYKCTLCDAGPFSAISLLDAHIGSKKHTKAKAMGMAGQKQATGTAGKEKEKEPAAPIETIADQMWNMPDYVREENGMLECTLCQAKVNAVMSMYLHLGGEKHARRCQASEFDDVIYIKEKGRLETMKDGRPVVRSGYKAPSKSSRSTKTSSSSTARSGAPDLPKGWEEYRDPQSGCSYYYNPSKGISVWERPGQERPVEAPEKPAPTLLPPGWTSVPCDGGCYYADVQTQASQWQAPEAYVHGDWGRFVDPAGRAYWSSPQKKVSFYEDDTNWSRLQDQQNREYWSNDILGIRFFERHPSEYTEHMAA